MAITEAQLELFLRKLAEKIRPDLTKRIRVNYVRGKTKVYHLKRDENERTHVVLNFSQRPGDPGFLEDLKRALDKVPLLFICARCGASAVGDCEKCYDWPYELISPEWKSLIRLWKRPVDRSQALVPIAQAITAGRAR